MAMVRTSDKYAGDNLRFRKAYIRERLSALKAERDVLVAEREQIDTRLGIEKPTAGQAVSQKAPPNSNEGPAKIVADGENGSVGMLARLRTFSVNGSARAS